MGGNLHNSTTTKWVISGPKALPDSVFAHHAADAKRQVVAMMNMPRGWTSHWEKEANGSYILVWSNSKGKEQSAYQTLVRKAALNDRLEREGATYPRRKVGAVDQKVAAAKVKGATNTLKRLTHVEAVRDLGLAYHVDSPAQFANMIASKGDQTIVAGVLDTGATFIGYHGKDEAFALQRKLERMRKIKFRTVTVIL